MSTTARISMLGMAATLFAGVAAGQPYPDSLGEELGDWPLWRAALKSLEPDGSIEWSLPDFGEIDPVAAIWARERIDQFREKFGSAESQGLEELSYPPESYCYVPDYETVVGTYPDPGVAFLDGILLLSEVAVTATVSEIIPGFSAAPGPMVLLALSDGIPLTERSPVPDYVLLPLRRMVIGGIPFCHNRFRGADYEPELGDRVVVIGSWRNGIVPLGRLAFRDGPRKGTGTIGELTAYMGRLESRGLLEATAHVARQFGGSEERLKLARAFRSLEPARADCPIDGLSVSSEGVWKLSLDCSEAER